MKTLKKTTAWLLALIIAFSCLAVSAVAAPTVTAVKIVQAPYKTTYFKGRDWDNGYWSFSESGFGKFVSNSKYICFMYNGGYYSRYSDKGMMDLNGLVIEVTYSDGSKEKMPYKEEIKNTYEIKQNICWSPASKLKEGSNSIYVYLEKNTNACDTYTVTLSDKTALKGDVNEDLKVNSADALIVLQHVVGIKTLAGTWFKTADLNNDKKLNSSDALSILRIAVGQDK